MPKLKIDGKPVEVEQGSTILDAGKKLGIDIPTLCFREGCDPLTSCMVCIVKVDNRFVPSCATIATDQMEVESETEEILEARRTALELLLSDHAGDCIAPCHSICPAGMNIPLMIRQIADSALKDAIITVKDDIPLPAILGRICPAPCEKGCRRGLHDSAVSICLLKRYVADVDLASKSPYMPPCDPKSGKNVAIIGAGPAGLSSACYLLQYGHACTIFDDHKKPGGALQYSVPEDRLPRDLVDAEIKIIERLGAKFQLNTKIDSIESLKDSFDAIIIATGQESDILPKDAKADRNTMKTDIEGVFVVGNAIGRRTNMAVRSVADGKIAANSIDQYLNELPIIGSPKIFTTHMGRLSESELKKFAESASPMDRIEPSGNKALKAFSDDETSFSDDEAISESLRCLHCDCRKADNCKLRDYSEIYDANPNRYRDQRRPYEQQLQHTGVIYESGKCISCGLCVQITSKAKEPLGLTFIGRGFTVKVGVPFNQTIEEGLQKVAKECVEACPTGALAFE